MMKAPFEKFKVSWNDDDGFFVFVEPEYMTPTGIEAARLFIEKAINDALGYCKDDDHREELQRKADERNRGKT